MKKLTLVLLFLAMSGCTHVNVSNHELLEPYETKWIDSKDLSRYPLNIEADTQCHIGRIKGVKHRICSNEARIKTITQMFKEQGYTTYHSTDKNTPKITLKAEDINPYLEKLTGFFNVITLGLSPLYHSTDYTVTYLDPINNIEITKTAQVSTTTSWFSLLQSNPMDLEQREIKYRTEKNLIKSVLTEANLGK